MKPERMHPIEQWETLFAEINLSRDADHCRKMLSELFGRMRRKSNLTLLGLRSIMSI